MAIQAQLYQENLRFPFLQDNNLCGGGFNQFYFSAQQKNHHHHHHQQQQQQILIQELQNLNQKNDKLWQNNDTTPPSSSMAYSSQEIDQYIKLHHERLRLVLQEQRRQQMAALVRRVEPKLSALLRVKDEEIERAAKRTVELEELLRRLEGENQVWQRVAQESEAMVVSLNQSLEQAREMAFSCPNIGAEDAESCCEVAWENGREEEGEEMERRGDSGEKQGMVCKACNSRNSCVLLLPCRHLCSCKACEAFLDHCPVCRTAKKASIEALIF